MNKDVMGMIVTYNPEINLLNKNINSIINQVDKLIVFDNNSDNFLDIEKMCDELNVEIAKYNFNFGIATPLFDGVIMANNLGYKYILTLDHDSVASNNLVADLLQGFTANDIAFVGPQHRDDTINEKKDFFSEDKNVGDIITSGALGDVQKILEVGNYLKDLNIDWVDHEICLRLRSKKYKIILSGKAYLTHHLGDRKEKHLLWIKVYPYNYSPKRLYFQARNMKYCWMKYNEFVKEKNAFKKFIKKTKLKIFLFEKNKIEKLKAIKRGLKDAVAFYNKIENNLSK